MTLRPSHALATVCLLAAMATPRTAGSAILQQPDGGPTRGNRCGAGKDLVVQALERLRADSPRDELERADELLKRAADLCSEIGEAWYYRALVEAKLGNSTRAESSPTPTTAARRPFVTVRTLWHRKTADACAPTVDSLPSSFPATVAALG